MSRSGCKGKRESSSDWQLFVAVFVAILRANQRYLSLVRPVFAKYIVGFFFFIDQYPKINSNIPDSVQGPTIAFNQHLCSTCTHPMHHASWTWTWSTLVVFGHKFIQAFHALSLPIQFPSYPMLFPWSNWPWQFKSRVFVQLGGFRWFEGWLDEVCCFVAKCTRIIFLQMLFSSLLSVWNRWNIIARKKSF